MAPPTAGVEPILSDKAAPADTEEAARQGKKASGKKKAVKGKQAKQGESVQVPTEGKAAAESSSAAKTKPPKASVGAATEGAAAPVLLGATAPTATAVAVAKAEAPPQQVMPPGVPAGSVAVPQKYVGTKTHGAVCLGCVTVCCCPCAPLLYTCPLDEKTVYRAPDGSEYEANGARCAGQAGLSNAQTHDAQQAGKWIYKASKALAAIA